MKLKALLFALTTVAGLAGATVAHAVYEPGRYHPLEGAQMKVVRAGTNFARATDFELSLGHRDAMEGQFMVLTYTKDGIVERKLFEVIRSRQGDCGSTVIEAEWEHTTKVTLLDHRTRLCKDFKPNLWEARVREGLNPEPSQDSTVELVGNPEPLYSPL